MHQVGGIFTVRTAPAPPPTVARGSIPLSSTQFVHLPGDCHPDGLCVDSEGAVWVGCYDTGEFLRIRAGGEVTHRISVDHGWVVAPCLGGADGHTLYVAINDTAHEGLMAGSSTGWITQARVDVPGSGSQ